MIGTSSQKAQPIPTLGSNRAVGPLPPQHHLRHPMDFYRPPNRYDFATNQPRFDMRTADLSKVVPSPFNEADLMSGAPRIPFTAPPPHRAMMPHPNNPLFNIPT